MSVVICWRHEFKLGLHYTRYICDNWNFQRHTVHYIYNNRCQMVNIHCPENLKSQHLNLWIKWKWVVVTAKRLDMFWIWKCYRKLAYTHILRRGTEINVMSISLLLFSFIYKTHQNNTFNQVKSVVNPRYLYSSFGIWYNNYTISKDTTNSINHVHYQICNMEIYM